MSGPATHELLAHLHGLVIRELATRLRTGTPSAETLSVARKALQDSGIGPHTNADRVKLRRLWRLQLAALLATVADAANPPSASTLGEVTRFLAVNGVGKDLSAGIDGARAAAALDLMSRLPFNTGPN